MKWRDHCRPIIAAVIEEVGASDMKVLRKALKEAYPYGERRMWPYKVWLSEIKNQLKRFSTPELPLFGVKYEP